MAKHRTHRTHSIAFKRQVVQEYLAGETLHGLARRHDLSRTLIRIWVDKYEAFDQRLLEAMGEVLAMRGVGTRFHERGNHQT